MSKIDENVIARVIWAVPCCCVLFLQNCANPVLHVVASLP